MSVIAIPRALRDRLGDEATDDLVLVFNSIDPDLVKLKAEISKDLATKADLSIEIAKVNERISIEIAKVNERISIETGKINERITLETGKINERITEEVGTLRTELSVKIENASKENIKWMFLFWIGQIAAMVAIIKFFVVK
ncbi:hypothetical protein [Candidatus Magnetominusculus xianensis]|uniref:DUF1640 domain-containing protein n=1 Tax=Candidatus Magnetominusculus xianensis TaxID=1748249 RepID=A0ABR5SC85_9BACT|nr:hypothetical protein [Candidatus Magnetominusculus xianensis]KWT73772.1 hypothetical protein ASN18_3354 [Candidatus Magnetominusculus xianensis]MBF0404793.1 hypothetical protein [Nitrospirota bacterium]